MPDPVRHDNGCHSVLDTESILYFLHTAHYTFLLWIPDQVRHNNACHSALEEPTPDLIRGNPQNNGCRVKPGMTRGGCRVKPDMTSKRPFADLSPRT